MTRYEEIMNIVPEESKELIKKVAGDIEFLESRLDELKKLPFIDVHPKNPVKQRVTPAGKQYKEMLQQYINCIKMVEYVIYKDKKTAGEEKEDSPLRKWFKANVN